MKISTLLAGTLNFILVEPLALIFGVLYYIFNTLSTFLGIFAGILLNLSDDLEEI